MSIFENKMSIMKSHIKFDFCKIMFMNKGKKLKELRIELGLTQKEFADKIGLSRTGIVAYEQSENPNPKILKRIEKIFDLNPNYFNSNMLASNALPKKQRDKIRVLLFNNFSDFEKRTNAMSVNYDYELLKLFGVENKSYLGLQTGASLLLFDETEDTLFTRDFVVYRIGEVVNLGVYDIKNKLIRYDSLEKDFGESDLTLGIDNIDKAINFEAVDYFKKVRYRILIQENELDLIDKKIINRLKQLK